MASFHAAADALAVLHEKPYHFTTSDSGLRMWGWIMLIAPTPVHVTLPQLCAACAPLQLLGVSVQELAVLVTAASASDTPLGSMPSVCTSDVPALLLRFLALPSTQAVLRNGGARAAERAVHWLAHSVTFLHKYEEILAPPLAVGLAGAYHRHHAFLQRWYHPAVQAVAAAAAAGDVQAVFERYAVLSPLPLHSVALAEATGVRLGSAAAQASVQDTCAWVQEVSTQPRVTWAAVDTLFRNAGLFDILSEANLRAIFQEVTGYMVATSVGACAWWCEAVAAEAVSAGEGARDDATPRSTDASSPHAGRHDHILLSAYEERGTKASLHAVPSARGFGPQGAGTSKRSQSASVSIQDEQRAAFARILGLPPSAWRRIVVDSVLAPFVEPPDSVVRPEAGYGYGATGTPFLAETDDLGSHAVTLDVEPHAEDGNGAVSASTPILTAAAFCELLARIADVLFVQQLDRLAEGRSVPEYFDPEFQGRLPWVGASLSTKFSRLLRFLRLRDAVNIRAAEHSVHDDSSARWLEHVQAKNTRVPLSSDGGLPMERVSTASVLRLVRDAKEEAEASEASLAKVAVHTSAGTLASNAFVADVPTQVFLAAPLPEPRATLTARPPTGRKVGPARGGAATGGSRSTASSRGGAAPLAVPLQFSAEEERLRAEFRASQRNTAAVAGLLRLPPPSEKFEHLARLLTVPLTSGADAGGAASRSGSNVKAMKNPGSNPAAAGKASRPASALATTSSKAASKSKEKQPWTMTVQPALVLERRAQLHAQASATEAKRVNSMATAARQARAKSAGRSRSKPAASRGGKGAAVINVAALEAKAHATAIAKAREVPVQFMDAMARARSTYAAPEPPSSATGPLPLPSADASNAPGTASPRTGTVSASGGTVSGASPALVAPPPNAHVVGLPATATALWLEDATLLRPADGFASARSSGASSTGIVRQKLTRPLSSSAAVPAYRSLLSMAEQQGAQYRDVTLFKPGPIATRGTYIPLPALDFSYRGMRLLQPVDVDIEEPGETQGAASGSGDMTDAVGSTGGTGPAAAAAAPATHPSSDAASTSSSTADGTLLRSTQVGTTSDKAAALARLAMRTAVHEAAPSETVQPETVVLPLLTFHRLARPPSSSSRRR